MAAGVAAYAAAEAERGALVVLGVAAASTVLLALGFVRGVAVAVPVSIAGLASAWCFAAWTSGGEVADRTAVVAAGIFAVSELAYWALDQIPTTDELELFARRLGGLALRGVGAVVATVLLLAALTLRATGGLVLEAVGVGAAVAVLAVLGSLARAAARER